MPSTNTNGTWIEEAAFSSHYYTSTTVWIIGYLRSSRSVVYTFQLDTNVDSVLFLSTDENPDNKVLIASRYSPQSIPIFLESDTK